MSRPSKAAIILSISAIIISIGLLSCTSKASTVAASGQTATVQKGNLSVSILASGNLVTAQESKLTFYSAGTVQDVMVKIGDQVKQGQVLAKLDTAPLESSLAQSQITVKTDQMNLENAEEPQTTSTGAVTTPDPLDIEIKQLQLQNAQANATEAQKQLDEATIMAPFDGLVTDVNVVPGDQVAANAVAVRIIDPVNFQVVVLVNEMEIYEISIGTPATVQAVALPNYTFPAKVSLVAQSPTIQSNVVNYQVTVQMDPVTAQTLQAQAAAIARSAAASAAGRTRSAATGGQTGSASSPGSAGSDNRTSNRQLPSGSQAGYQPSGNRTASFTGTQGGQAQTAIATVPSDFRLREGLTVTVSITSEQKNDILLVPNKAITSRSGRSYVQVVSGTQTTEKQIQTGITDGQNTEVVSGLNEGDVVSTATNISTTQTTATNNSQQPRMGGGTSIGGVRLPTTTGR